MDTCARKPRTQEPAAERHYTASEVAALWRFNIETVRRLFVHEPGVVVLQAQAGNGRRRYRTLRIPQTVLDRVHKQLQVEEL